MPIPYYIANPSPFGGLEEDDPDRRQEGPFDAPPPSVDQTKQAKQPAIDPFADDPNDPRLQRIHELDKQISGRNGTLAGFFGALSPHGDKVQASLMAQRHMLGNEYHGDQQLRRQLASSQMLQESAFRRADATEKAARERAAGTEYRADRSLEGTKYGADRRYDGVEYRTDNQQFAPKGMTTPGMFQDANGQWMVAVFDPNTGNVTAKAAGGKLVKPSPEPGNGKAPVNPQVPVLQAEMKQLNKVLNDPNVVLSDEQRLEYLRKYNMAKRKIEQMSGQPASAPSATPSTAPAVKDTKATVRPSATGPNGEKIEWDGTAWVPAS